MANRKWVIVGATSVLGLGMIAGGAVLTANAMNLEDTKGTQVGEPISVPNPAIESEQPTPDHETPTHVSAVSIQSPVSAQSPASVQSPMSAQSPMSVQSPVVVSPASPISVQSVQSVSVPSAD